MSQDPAPRPADADAPDLDALPVTALKGVGPRLAQRLERLGIATVQDLLFHLPLRYQDRTHVSPIGGLQPGAEAVVVGTVEAADVVYRGRRALVCRVADGTGPLTLRFFHFNAAQQARLVRGCRLRLFGEVRPGPGGLEMVHPEYQVLEQDQACAPEAHLTPVYPATEGLHQLSLRGLVQQALERYAPAIHEWLPAEVLAPLRLPTLTQALAQAHTPAPGEPVALLEQGRHPAQRRLAFEELLAHQLSLGRLRAENRRHRAPPLAAEGRLLTAFWAALPFSPTGAQRRVVAEILADLRRDCPMQRLVQGDVGSGKTLVAVAACLQAVESGWQAAVMAPTEILAEQHWRNVSRWLEPLGIEVAWMSGRLGARARREMLAAIASGAARVAVGTHALFQAEVGFAGLGLVVVDEQHRFGVHQRLQLREKGARDGYWPHQLIMTATPIPRTLAQSVYADLDVSVIDELPPGRQPVETVVVPDARRADVVARIHGACRQGRQAYWVCPLIEESESLQLQTATDTEARLREALPGLRIGLVHGRLRAPEKEAVMAAFKAGALDLLVATTVIEVGVDVPNASLMVIENAERLGLAQLHQLRGRVGRGGAASNCVLMYQPPLSAAARERLAVMRATHDGFEIARRDLEMRGPGEVLGTRQTGEQQFRIADLVRDQTLLPGVTRAAELMQRAYPERVTPVIRRWLRRAEAYGSV